MRGIERRLQSFAKQPGTGATEPLKLHFSGDIRRPIGRHNGIGGGGGADNGEGNNPAKEQKYTPDETAAMKAHGQQALRHWRDGLRQIGEILGDKELPEKDRIDRAADVWARHEIAGEIGVGYLMEFEPEGDEPIGKELLDRLYKESIQAARERSKSEVTEEHKSERSEGNQAPATKSDTREAQRAGGAGGNKAAKTEKTKEVLAQVNRNQPQNQSRHSGPEARQPEPRGYEGHHTQDSSGQKSVQQEQQGSKQGDSRADSSIPAQTERDEPGSDHRPASPPAPPPSHRSYDATESRDTHSRSGIDRTSDKGTGGKETVRETRPPSPGPSGPDISK